MAEILPYSFHNLGDSALLISLGNTMDDEIHRAVIDIYDRLKAESGKLFTDLVPGYNSLGVFYDPAKASALPGEGSAFSKIQRHIRSVLTVRHKRKYPEARELRIPVCYDGEHGPDLASLAEQKGLSPEEVIDIHCTTQYRVYMLGFLPGFAYMGKLDERIACPRKNSPRTEVPPGSVGIAGDQTGIYPLTSPGGWQLIGRTPLKLFDRDREPPAYFQPGDLVIFYPISANEFANY